MSICSLIDALYRKESRAIYATLIRLLGDMDLAEEAMHEAFNIALTRWDEEGIPENPRAWIISTARFKAIDQWRRNERFDNNVDYQNLVAEKEDHHQMQYADDIDDDQLRLIFTCCHPALDPKVQVSLTLREVCGLTTEEIASAFLVSAPTMAQRIVRGKAKIRTARMPFEIPEKSEIPQRLDAVLAVIYLVYNEGYSATSGGQVLRSDLSKEAIRLARLVYGMLPDPEVAGLLALMLLNESRAAARVDAQGDIVLLEDQDRDLWDQQAISEGSTLVAQALASRDFGFYTLQAAISASHAQALCWQDTNWNQISSLYETLLLVEPSPLIELNHAVAIAMRDGAKAGLRLMQPLLQSKALQRYHLLYAAYGDLLQRSGQNRQAREAFERAIELVQQVPERRTLQRKLAALGNA